MRVVFLGVLKSAADKPHPRRLGLYVRNGLRVDAQNSGFVELDHLVRQKRREDIVDFDDETVLLSEGLVELQHVKVGHQYEVILGPLLQCLDHEGVQQHHVVVEGMRNLEQPQEIRVPVHDLHAGLQDGYQRVDQVVNFEYPNKPNFGAPAKYIIVGDLANAAVLVQVLVEGQLHEVVVQGDKYFVDEELLQIALGEGHIGLLVRVAFGEYFELLVGHDVRQVVLALLEYLDPEGQHLQFLLYIAFILHVFEQVLDEFLLLVPLKVLVVEFPGAGQERSLEGVVQQVSHA